MRNPLLPAALAASLFLSACGASAAADDSAVGNGASEVPQAIGMCHYDRPECEDTVVEPADPDEFDTGAARQAARDLLGQVEADVAAADARVSRRGDEQMMLTEDYVLGRITVEMDRDAEGVFRVTSATVELPDGPETFGS